MPARYHVHTRPMPPRKRPVGKYGIVDWSEDCSSCRNCVKRECVYGVYAEDDQRVREAVDYVDYLYDCRSCLSCVQGCTKGLLARRINPAYLRLGDDFWTPDIISTTWFQAETGKVPVSGAGYGGKFSGKGFDGIWTDMSEIVRPTRDGIHGREYINTAVDVGRKPAMLTFEGNELVTKCPPVKTIQLPVIFDVMNWHRPPLVVRKAIAAAARELGTIALFRLDDLHVDMRRYASAIGPFFNGVELAENWLRRAQVAEFDESSDLLWWMERIRRIKPDVIGLVRIPADRTAADKAAELARLGADVLHLSADSIGSEYGPEPRHIKDTLREVHLRLVREGLRDEVTLIVSGGIALAEHMAKAIICGADLVAVDIPLMIALECRVCGKCRQGIACPEDFDNLSLNYAVQRIVNLMGAWHLQLIEVLGAMGIREVRRLRGDIGRAMFVEDLERESFGKIFGRAGAGSA